MFEVEVSSLCVVKESCIYVVKIVDSVLEGVGCYLVVNDCY